MAFLRLFVCSLLTYSTACHGAGFWEWCTNIVQNIIPQNVRLSESPEYQAKWKTFVDSQRSSWKETLLVGPESELNLTATRAEELLRAAFVSSFPKNNEPSVFTFSWEGRRYSLISKMRKTDGAISEFGKLQTIHHQTRTEEMAWAVNTLLALNIMAPVISDSKNSVGLMIPSKSRVWHQATATPGYLPFVSLVQLLDFITANLDRQEPGNFRISNDGRPFAFDFDYCRRDLPVKFVASNIFFFAVTDTELLGKNVRLRVPAMIPRSVYLRLKTLERAELLREMQMRKVELSSVEFNYMFEAIQIAAASFDELIQIYGEHLILL